MDRISEIFLETLKCALKNEEYSGKAQITEPELKAVLELAGNQKLFAMILNHLHDAPAASQLHPALYMNYRQEMFQEVTGQVIRTEKFLRLYKELAAAGIHAIVVKGIVCRDLYSQPDERSSGDEDVFIPDEEFESCHSLLLKNGLQLEGSPEHVLEEHEIPYIDPITNLRIELHKQLFPPASEAYGEFNTFFLKAHEKAAHIQLRHSDDSSQEISVLTLDATDNLLYMILHALKHFFHGGFGIRQVCDMALWANAYSSNVHWNDLLRECREVRADVFAGALLKIGEKYLTLDPEKAQLTPEWRSIMADIDEQDLLEDLLDSGIYGGSTMSRKHSSNITLDAVAADKHGKETHGLLATVFPSANKLEKRYVYLRKAPWLLPVAWIQRIFVFYRERSEANNAVETLKIGKNRIKILQEYGVIR